ncbi:peptide-methionine (R)-S-oxide reductase MsrB [Dyella sp. 2HG41-7]|uniref:peptide-methionine (R)-S-oxide reductase MsrB n=1 Tax=Dyella sp. 2HG41-7 TaxID=2883239 RepID=UPI001F3FF49C|nr:peptide-methionine (R)-S-oxide reductase MsrB [Dyella sp. 2HG41-7]
MNEQKTGKTEEQWRASLTPEQFAICRCSATEPPFSGKWYRHKELGTYVCVACRTPLFSSETKYDSGSGWPSFFQPIKRGGINLVPDKTHGMHRTEVRCAECDSHLGHVFPDGPKPTGLRYCINSLALDFEPSKGL